METNMTRPRRGQTVFNAGQFRRKMVELGVSQTKLAEVSGVTQPAISAVLNQRAYAGASRVSRMQDALHQLAQEIEAQKRAEAEANAAEEALEEQRVEKPAEHPERHEGPHSEPKTPVMVRIRRL